MGKLKFLMWTAIAALAGACSGGSEETLSGGAQGPGNEPGAAEVASLTLLTSSPQIPSDGAAEATITALVRDSNNNVMDGVGVVFASDTGSLTVSQPAQTDETGVVTATLTTAGDPENRTITVTGIADGSVEASVEVDVVGTTLELNGPSSLPLSEEGSYNVVLSDAGGTGIGNTSVTIASSNGNGISDTPLITDNLGRASFTLSATNGGTDELTADALGIQAVQTVEVSNDTFAFSSPEADQEIALGQNETVTVNWLTGGSPVIGGQINFSTTRGTVSSTTANTDSSGNASVTVSATNAGPAVLTATNGDGTSIQRTVEFVATTPATLELQASPFTVPANDQSAITAVVRDAQGNLVKNQTVEFNLIDTTGGSLTVPQDVTDSQGRARTFYNASSTTSSVDGVQIDAQVQGMAGVSDSVNLTVAQREVFIAIGTGNEIEEPNTAQYRKEWVVQVTDAQGNGVDGVNVSVSVLSERYWEGSRSYIDPPGAWVTRRGNEAFPHQGNPVAATHPSGSGCVDEDFNGNGILDTGDGEDINGNGRIEAGNIATAVAQDGGGSTITTDENGFAIVDVYWPQEYAYWLEVTLEARASVQGSESAKSTTFVLDGLADDFSDENVSPPGPNSPFGTDGNCATPPPPDGP